MMAEITATEEAARLGLRLAVVLPCMTVAPTLQQALNLTNHHIGRYVMGTKRAYPNAVAAYVDVRDVARAHVLVYEGAGAAGRYLCVVAVLHLAQLVAVLRDLFPQYPVTAKYIHSLLARSGRESLPVVATDEQTNPAIKGADLSARNRNQTLGRASRAYKTNRRA